MPVAAAAASSPVGDGVERGLERARHLGLDAELAEAQAYELVSDLMEHSTTARDVTSEQVATLAEFATLGLAAGVPAGKVRGWIGDICGSWG
jgi:hypothetical protein